MSSGSSEKKIVFKKLVLGAQTPIAELDVAQEQEELLEVPAEQQEALQFSGDIFDQFYRPLSATEGVTKLEEIAREPIATPTAVKRPSLYEFTEKERKVQEVAEALAHHIYQLAQKIRETDLDVYLSAFNVVLSSLSCNDAKLILDAANEFFTEHYFTPIRDRGERPEIYHQIIKRVGHECADRISKIVKGLDAPMVARKLWDIYHGPVADKRAAIEAALLDLTEKQVRAVREEFLLIPYKDLAKQLFTILNRKAVEAPTGLRRTIGKTEVYTQKKQQAFRSREDLREIRSILAGRSTAELSLIKRFYLDESPLDADEYGCCIESHIREKLLPSDAERALALLEGWSASGEATAIFELLFPDGKDATIDDTLSDPRESVDRDHTQGIGPLLRKLKKRRMFRGKDSVSNRILNNYELIAERVAALSVQRFRKTNEALLQSYGVELDPSLFTSLASFDARLAATTIYDRLRINCEVDELLKPLEYLDPRQALSVQFAFNCLYGEEMRETLNKRGLLPSVGDAGSAKVERYLSGVARWPLNIDLLARYRGDIPDATVWEHDYVRDAVDEDLAIQLAELLDHDESDGARDDVVRNFLAQLSYRQRGQIERAFFELTDPHTPLLLALKEGLSEQGYQDALLLLAGRDIPTLLTELRGEITALLSLREMPSEYVAIVRDRYFAQFGEDLVKSVMVRSAQEEEDTVIERIAILKSPEVMQVRGALAELRKERQQDAYKIRPYFESPLLERLAFERAYDLLFPRLRVHLKFAVARQALPIPLLSELILLLEGVAPEVTARLLECFDSVNISELYDILELNKHDQRTIEECYDLLLPEATLRSSIKEMKVDLDLINEVLLHLEGYSARDVAKEVRALFDQHSGDALGEGILEIVALPTSHRPNPRIPDDMNWIDEMVYQIAYAYQRLFGEELLFALRKSGASDVVIEQVTERIFGVEVTNSAREVFEILTLNKEGRRETEHSEERLCSYLESRGSRHRDRLLRAYNSCWAHIPGYEETFEDIAKYFVNSGVKKKILAILLGGQAKLHGKAGEPLEPRS